MKKYIVYYDEAWRWPIAWPVYVWLSIKLEDFNDSEFDDSKKITSKNRGKLYLQIQELEKNKSIIVWYGSWSEKEIDNYWIIDSIKRWIIRALNQLFLKIENPNIINEVELFKYFMDKYVEKVVLDGDSDFWLSKFTDTETIIKWDWKVKMISIASIVAKEEHDKYIIENYWKWTQYEKYGFDSHKWYETKVHSEAIKEYGVSDIHRKTFCKKYLITN